MDPTKGKDNRQQLNVIDQDEAEGLAITQAQILDSYNSGTSDSVSYFSRADVLEAPYEYTDEDA